MLSLRKTAVCLAACLIVAATPAFSFGQSAPAPSGGEVIPGPLTLADLESMALAQNPTLVQAGAQVQMSRGKALQAGLLPNPRIGYLAEQMGADGTAGEMQGMFVEQDIVTGGKLRLSRSKFAQEARQAELQVLAQQYRVLHGVRIAFYEALAWQRRLQLRQQLLRNGEDAATTVRELVNVGQANQTDVMRAEVELQRTKTNVRMAERRLQGSWEELAAVVGIAEVAPGGLEDSMDFGPETALDRRTALDNLLAMSPELQFAQAEVVRDRIALERECVESIPDINLRAETGYNFEVDDAVAGVEIGLRLPLFDRNQGTILQAQAELSRAQAEVERVELMLRRRFAQAFAEYEASRQSAETYRNDILPKAEDIYQANLGSFQARRAAWPQVLDAQREYYEIHEVYLDELLQARRAETLIASFLLEDGLSQPPLPEPEGHRDSVPKPR